MHRLLLGLLLFAPACAREADRPNVLLITIDTLRADRISAAGSTRATTPHLDRLAAEGLLFTHAETPRGKTTPAIASLMTGLYPHEHGVRDLLIPVARTTPVLAERFREAGYSTAAIIGNFVLKHEFSGLKRGFDQWTESLPESLGVPPDDVPQRTARSLTDGALVALGLKQDCEAGPHAAFREQGKSWFAWLHYMDPHGLYDPPPEHRVFVRTEPDWIPTVVDAKDRASGHVPHVAEYNVPSSARADDGRIDAALVRDLYDGEVHYVDAEIGRLLAEMRSAGLLENTIVVVTSDHGESLGEHDYWFEHGRDAYEASCRVPLIVRLPEGYERRPLPGRRDGDVSLADLAPTLLDLVHLPPLLAPERDAEARGMSRAKLVLDGDDRVNPVFVEKVERVDRAGAVQHKGVRIGDWKLVQRFARMPARDTSGKRAIDGVAAEMKVLGEELYDLAADPSEARNLIGDPPRKAPLERLRKELARFTAEDEHFAEVAKELQKRRDDLRREDAETLRIIEALGY